MKKILIILIILSLTLIISPMVIIKNSNKKIENKMLEYCETIFSGMDEDIENTKITIKDMKDFFDLNIDEFKNYNQEESYIEASIKNKKLKCNVKLLK